MSSKPCTACGEWKGLDEYHKRPGNRDGLRSSCKTCMAAGNRKWVTGNRDRNRVLARRHQAKKFAVSPEKILAANARRRAAEFDATPSWANEFFMEEAHHLARLREQATGFKWHVDHIVPLCSPFVCGLHTHDNLRVIPATVNLAKGNRTWPDMP